MELKVGDLFKMPHCGHSGVIVWIREGGKAIAVRGFKKNRLCPFCGSRDSSGDWDPMAYIIYLEEGSEGRSG